MSMGSTNRDRPVGQTTGSHERPAQRLSAPVMKFNLDEEGGQLREEEAFQRGSHNAKTLFKEAELRVTLIVAKIGARLEQHSTFGRISIQTLSGAVRIHLSDQDIELPAGRLLALEPNIVHGVEVLEESAFLLTLAWPLEAQDSERV